MKSIIITLLFAMGMNAQNIQSNGTHFIEGIKDKKWNNNNGKDFTDASFSDFTGSCYVILEIDATADVSFQSFAEIKKGRLELKLTDEQDNTYFYCRTTERCLVEKDIVLEKGKKYRLYFTGENAKGNYLVNWKIKK